MFLKPKIPKARRRRTVLKSGHILEIGWHFGRQLWVSEVYHPSDYDSEDVWEAGKRFFGKTPREVLGKVRLEVARHVNPDIGKVADRLVGNETSPFTATIDQDGYPLDDYRWDDNYPPIQKRKKKLRTI
jgi:hypothetical protein